MLKLPSPFWGRAGDGAYHPAGVVYTHHFLKCSSSLHLLGEGLGMEPITPLGLYDVGWMQDSRFWILGLITFQYEHFQQNAKQI
jgi:hypothetical protein